MGVIRNQDYIISCSNFSSDHNPLSAVVNEWFNSMVSLSVCPRKVPKEQPGHFGPFQWVDTDMVRSYPLTFFSSFSVLFPVFSSTELLKQAWSLFSFSKISPWFLLFCTSGCQGFKGESRDEMGCATGWRRCAEQLVKFLPITMKLDGITVYIPLDYFFDTWGAINSGSMSESSRGVSMLYSCACLTGRTTLPLRCGIGRSEWCAGSGSVKKYGWSNACKKHAHLYVTGTKHESAIFVSLSGDAWLDPCTNTQFTLKSDNNICPKQDRR